MKGHTVPWAFLPKEIQAILAIGMVVFIVMKTHKDQRVVQRWWPWLCAVASVLITPLLMGWLGFTAQGIQAKSMAAELQSLATELSWLKPVISALQSISTKGMGLKTAGAIFVAGGCFGRLVVLRGYNQLRAMGILPVEDQAANKQVEANPQPRQAVEQENPSAQPQHREPDHAHDD